MNSFVKNLGINPYITIDLTSAITFYDKGFTIKIVSCYSDFLIFSNNNESHSNSDLIN